MLMQPSLQNWRSWKPQDKQRLLAKLQARNQPFDRPSPDVSAWIDAEVFIEQPQGTDVTLIPFHLWPAQQDALKVIESTLQVIILKARQLGLSWLVIAYAVWLCLWHRNQTVLVFSKDQDSANEIVRRAGVVYKNLKNKPCQLVTDNVTQLAFDNGSRIKSFAATEDAGSSFTASLIILDEFAKMRYAETLYTSVKPTINDGGRVVIISTAKGEGNPFHKLWDGAVKGINALRPIFIPWSARPGRDAAWYARAESDAISSAHHKQEYPGDAAEAFTLVGEERFLPSMILWDALKENLPALGREPMVLGMDAGVSNDSFGLVGVTRHPSRPQDVAARFVQVWTPPAGGQIDFSGPENAVRDLVKRFNVVQLAYDQYMLVDFAQRLTRDGVVWCKSFPQGGQRLEADKQLLDLIIGKRLAHDGNEFLRAHIANANKKPDVETRKLRIIKREASLKIDLCICISQASYEILRLAV
jgi:hypothetical protein